MTELFKEFIERNNIDLKAIYKELQIYHEKEINALISDNKLEGKTRKRLVSVAEIIGYDYNWRGHSNNLADNFSRFFDNGSSYQSRSIGMLEYTGDNIIEKLYQSFKKEPIRVLELDNGRKIISGNGLHRYTLIRILYISELQKIRGNKEEEEYLKCKFEIPVELTQVDLLKTYCNFLIKRTCLLDDVSVSNIPGQEEHVHISINGEELILDRHQLLEYTKKRIKSLNGDMKNWFVGIVSNCCKMYDSFQKFIEDNFKEDLVPLIQETDKKGRGV